MAATEGKSRARGNMFDEDITSSYSLSLPAPRTDAYIVHVHKPMDDAEKYMLDAFHHQYVAVEGRSAIGQLVDTRIGDMTIYTAQVMGGSMECVEAIEYAANLGRLSKRLQDFDNKLLDLTGRQLLETQGIAVRTMHEDMRENVYKPPPPPPQPKRKGAIPGFFQFLFGER